MPQPLPDASTPLLERDAELAVLAQRVTAARAGTGGALMIEGPAGIGKTRLLDAARGRARECGFRVLVARGNELERDFAFGVARSLFEPALASASCEERAALLDGAAQLAAPVLDLTRGGEEAQRPTLAALHGLYWLTANLAERSPLLLAIDDAQWADAPSLQALAYTLRRLEALPVLLVLAARAAEPQAPGALLDALRADPLTTAVRPGPLSRPSAGDLVRGLLGEEPDEKFADACYASTGGNPLLLTALLGALREAEVTPSAAALDQVQRRAPAIVATFVMPRLRHLPPAAAALSRAVAILGPGAQLRHAAIVAGLDAAAAADAADQLVGAELLAAGSPLQFAHPLIGQAIAERMPAAERHRGHVRAARELAADQAPAESVAAHLLQVERLRDPWVVERLRDAARAALAKGAPEAAITYLARALEEPPSPEARAAVLFELGSAQVLQGMTEGFATLEAARELTTDPATRGHIALRLARALEAAWEHPRALEALEQGVDDVGDDDPALRLRLEAELVSLARPHPATRAAARQRLECLREHAQPTTLAGCTLLVNLAVEAVQREGKAQEAAELAERAVAGIREFDAASVNVLFLATHVLSAVDRLDVAAQACDAAVEEARRRAALIELGAALGSRAAVAFRRGAIQDAEADMRLSTDILRGTDITYPRRYLLAFLLPALVERGDLATAEAELNESPVDLNLAFLLDAIGRLRCAQGRAEEGLRHFLACGPRLERRGWRHPGLIPWRANAALAYRQLGRSDEARRLADEDAAEARRYGARIALGVALRAQGLVSNRIELLREAVDVLADSPARLEHARTLVELGAALRRANLRLDARVPLRRGLDLAHRCGATALVARAYDELTASGARPRRPALTGLDALTPSERRVAQMAADGLSNRAIAQALFVTVKTVEVHLGSTYRKLNVSSRTDLPAALAR